MMHGQKNIKLLHTVQDTLQPTSVNTSLHFAFATKKSWWRNWTDVVVIDSPCAKCSAVQCIHYTQEGHCYSSCYGFL